MKYSGWWRRATVALALKPIFILFPAEFSALNFILVRLKQQVPGTG